MLKRLKFNWLAEGILISMAVAICFVSCYGLIKRRAQSYSQDPIETESNISWLYSNNLLLYHDLYNMLNHSQEDYTDIYYTLPEDFENIDPTKAEQIKEGLNYIKTYFDELEADFSDLNTAYDYMIKDLNGEVVISNTGEEELDQERYFLYITFRYDENGDAAVTQAISRNSGSQLRKYASEMVRPGRSLIGEEWLSENINIQYSIQTLESLIPSNSPANCEITYAMDFNTADGIRNGEIDIPRYQGYRYNTLSAYTRAGCGDLYLLGIFLMLALAVLLPVAEKKTLWNTYSSCRLPLEAICGILLFLLVMRKNVISIVVQITSGQYNNGLFKLASQSGLFNAIMVAANIVMLMILFTLSWYCGICIREFRVAGIGGYIKKRCLIYRFFPFMKHKIVGFYHALTHLDVTHKADKTILRIVIYNAAILFVISTLWVFGFVAIVIYSLILYFILRKYVSNLQQQYQVLLKATNEIADGNLNVKIQEDLGVFEPFRPQISRIQKGFKNAVEEEVKSQRMKSELITNVSHDLKTPLTAIITYIGLLKDENITKEQRSEYLDTLERKSLRLKVLIEDLFEVSRANSRSVKLEKMDVDIVNLIKQAQLEVSDKLAASNLDVKMLLPKEKIILSLDSQKTFRIYENLFGNIAKYALPGTRVYISGMVTEDNVTITMKNISAQEILINPEELTDRFVRGDASRNTEGSGLGLAIAKSFTELQDGRLILEVDGDLFKITTIWRRNP